MKTIFITLSTLFLLCTSGILPQQTYTVDIPGTKNSIYYSETYGYGFAYPGSLSAGKLEGVAIYRSYITWSNIINYIPEGAEITEVIFFITWGGNGSTSAQIEFRDFEYVSGNAEQIWSNIESGTLWDTKLATTTEYSFPELADWVLNIVNGSGVDPIRVGIKNQNESSSDYYVHYSSVVNLRISYTITTNVTQVDEQGSPFGRVGLWLGNDWNYINVPFGLDLQPGTNLGLQSDTNYKAETYQKYWQWAQNSEVTFTNHHNFTIQSGINEITATFKTSDEGVTIKNNLESTGLDGGSVEFADPWLIDYPDPLFGNTKRNRGMKQTGDDALLFYTRQSPFNPSNGSQYKGVFLGQDPSQTSTYYKVGMLEEQTININGQNRKFYPYKWRNDGGVTFQNEYARQTGVVFNSTDATATAILKGQLMSNDQNGISSGSQRKLVRTDNGIYHCVYESMGEVWYTHSLTTNYNGQWRQDICISNTIGNMSKNPSIDFEGNKIKTVSVILSTVKYSLAASTFLPVEKLYVDSWNKN
ncbi:MAG: hypothetical protein M5T52_13530 [Ignavibacteriaceae bacterium]|nr:hypothetical protein [Ignavibacteriaceae bacterium]